MMTGADVHPYVPEARVEVFTGVQTRRRWPAHVKAQIVAESYATTVGETALRHSVSKNQIFGWRRHARSGSPGFAPVVVADREARCEAFGVIEAELAGARIRIPPGSSPELVRLVLLTLKTGR